VQGMRVIVELCAFCQGEECPEAICSRCLASRFGSRSRSLTSTEDESESRYRPGRSQGSDERSVFFEREWDPERPDASRASDYIAGMKPSCIIIPAMSG
jgi:hypothetical protein